MMRVTRDFVFVPEYIYDNVEYMFYNKALIRRKNNIYEYAYLDEQHKEFFFNNAKVINKPYKDLEVTKSKNKQKRYIYKINGVEINHDYCVDKGLSFSSIRTLFRDDKYKGKDSIIYKGYTIVRELT